MNGDPKQAFHISHNGKKYGPLTLAALSQRHLTHDMLAWQEGMPEWLPIGEIPELARYVRHAAPGRTTAPPRVTPPAPTLPPDPAGPGVPPIPTPVVPPPPRSGLATTMGVFNIILASLALVVMPVMIWGELAMPAPAEDLVSEITASDEARLGRTISFSVSLIVAVLLLIAGIGLVRRRRWGRIVSIVAANVSIFQLIGGCSFGLFAIVLPLQSRASDLELPELQAAWMGAAGAVFCMNGLGIAYDVFLLATMSFQSVKKSLI